MTSLEVINQLLETRNDELEKRIEKLETELEQIKNERWTATQSAAASEMTLTSSIGS